jgi:hypothetical protein
MGHVRVEEAERPVLAGAEGTGAAAELGADVDGGELGPAGQGAFAGGDEDPAGVAAEGGAQGLPGVLEGEFGDGFVGHGGLHVDLGKEFPNTRRKIEMAGSGAFRAVGKSDPILGAGETKVPP